MSHLIKWHPWTGTNMLVGPEIGRGSYGIVCLGMNKEKKIAIKMEKVTSKEPTMMWEYRCYRMLGTHDGIAKILHVGRYGPYTALAMDLMGSTLSQIFEEHVLCFSLKTVLMVAMQLLSLIEYVHSRRIIHRDVKTSNFCIGYSAARRNIIHIIDFGLSKQYIADGTSEHIPYRENVKIVGTPQFMSINGHKRIEQSRRDDLESAGYLLVYLLKGSLPWQSVNGATVAEFHAKMAEAKLQTAQVLLQEKYPYEFRQYFNYVRGLGFKATPDYRHLRKIFSDLFDSKRYVNDGKFDWC